MKTALRIALVGDHNPTVRAHIAIPKALVLAAGVVGCKVGFEWTATTALDHNVEDMLSAFDAIWCVPNSPYASMEGALAAVRLARESRRPFLGTCGGFQHALIEYARNVLRFREADHAESNPNAAMPLISRLACSLAGVKGAIMITPGSLVGMIYGGLETVENYQCNFGLNPRYESLLSDGKMIVTGRDEEDGARAVELTDHPFFIATLFQPEQSAFAGKAHPLICAFVRATANSR